MGRRAARAVRIDEDGTLHAELGDLPERTRRRAAAAVRAVLQAVLDAELGAETPLSEQAWEAAWLPEIERRARELAEGRVKTVSLEVALRRVGAAARGSR
jgi:hypothetical protein